MATTGYNQATGRCPSQCFEAGASSCNCFHLQPEGCNYGSGEQQCLDESSPNFLRFYNLGCQVDGVSQCTEASPCGGLASGACPFTPEDPQQTAGFYIIAGKGHGDFKDDPAFRNISTQWGAPQNFRWLAQVARNPTPQISTTVATTTTPQTTTTTPQTTSTLATTTTVPQTTSTLATTTVPQTTQPPPTTTTQAPPTTSTVQTTSQATTTTTQACVDDPDWRYTTNKGRKKTCSWVAKKKTISRCTRVGDDGRTGQEACECACA